MNHLTRRNLFATAVAAVVAPSVEAQTSLEDDIKSARDIIANNAAELAKIEIPVATEPAYIFRTL